MWCSSHVISQWRTSKERNFEWTVGKLGLGVACLGSNFAEEHLKVLVGHRPWLQRWPTASWAVMAPAKL